MLFRVLSKVLQAEVMVVDVRDHDYTGGHITGSVHRPSDDFEGLVGEMADSLGSAPMVVFLCMSSQVSEHLPQPRQPVFTDPWEAVRGSTRTGARESVWSSNTRDVRPYLASVHDADCCSARY